MYVYCIFFEWYERALIYYDGRQDIFVFTGGVKFAREKMLSPPESNSNTGNL